MRSFILKANAAATTPDFDLDDLRAAGNMEIVCHCIMNALFVAGGFRRDTTIHVVLEGPRDPPKTISFLGARIKDLHAVELDIATKIKTALIRSKQMAPDAQKQVGSGVILTRRSFQQVLEECARASQVFYLHKTGEDLRSVSISGDVTFVLGDYMGLTKPARKLLENVGAKGVSLGPNMLFASQCIPIVHNELDRRR